MKSILLQKRVATAPVVNSPNGQMSYEEALAGYEEALANEEKAVAAMSGGMSYEEAVATLFCTEEEEDAVIEAILKDDPEGEQGIPWDQVKAEEDRLLEEWKAAALRRCAAKRNLSKYDR